MKNVILLCCLLGVLACDQKRISPLELPLQGTYVVSHLTQYQNGQLVFKSNLPAYIGDKRIRHGISISLSKSKSTETNAYANYAWSLTRGNYTSGTGSFLKINYSPSRRPGLFNFYGASGDSLGTSDGSTLSFDYTVPDSLGQPTRFVYLARKVSSKENYFTFNY
jgi:hypothetical protein